MQFSVRLIRIAFFLLALGALFTPGCKDDTNDTTDVNLVQDYTNEVAFRWNETFLEVERYAAGYRPGPAPRALAYLGLASYEALITAMPEYNSIANRYAGLSIPQVEAAQTYHWPTVVNAIYGYMMPKFFVKVQADQFQKIATLENELNAKYQGETDAATFSRSQAYGRAVAEAVWNWSVTDKIGHDHYLDPFQNYNWEEHYKKAGDWKPTFPGPGKPMGGVWGSARTFALSETQLLCRQPLPYSENNQSELYSQALEVYAQNTPKLSYEAEWIGEFWSDDLVNLTFSPGPRWLAVGNQVIKKENSDLETAIFMNVKLGLALNDASVGCWKSKYYYNVERPQTYINRLIDPNWKPALYNPLTKEEGVTPSFPAYPSGHSTMGAAGAEVLASIFGYSYAMTDHCHENRTEFEGKPRSFGSFREMAEENAWSRVPLGVHFRMDCTEGVRYGTEIGRRVNELPWQK